MTFKPASFSPSRAMSNTVVETTPITGELLPQIDLNKLDTQLNFAIEMYQKELTEAGLDSREVYSQVYTQLKDSDIFSSHGISTLGQSSAERIGEYSDSMLKHVRTKDLEEMGDNLNSVIGLAKGVDISSLVGKESFFGKIVQKFRNTKEAILAQFNSVSTQLDRVVKEVDSQQNRLQERSVQLDVVFNQNILQYKSLSQSIVYGEARGLLVKDKIDELSSDPEMHSSPLKAQMVSDLKSNYDRIQKRTHDLKSLQLLALQTAPMIRMVQTNNITLIEKFNNIKTLTIPSWKKQFTLAISMLEQKKSLELASKIDDATNDLIRKNADLLRQNTLQTAQANQRSAIDIETLEHVQQTLISTLEDVVAIEQEGARNRKVADEKMVSMRQELSNLMTNKKGNE
ncbi:toxic anion resistance protein [Vibrio neptunius]|uniref:Toxic anion resistance protein n=2 Tax=Vibrio neptunius TaxID=170651 RepID=A0ABS3A2I2_9VIBR|nr:toxic anion resistance protein [Vibrio neptunius]MBN3493957.1 toxic anion resistance protein [Vibrio neptunius]MBN3516453.1 toxic anion resistance protein [Vibrio neptunius]MBN3550575.1 toxic anion resistance protein [Vibrio neptunius]MBN3578706.1 toxic anion resistance protein [Vibrio neptunius]MCH9872371.1 toxic anion resistance protein [Vibrio neptunius]